MEESAQSIQGDSERQQSRVDLWLLRANLGLSYEERIAQHQSTIDCIAELQRIGSENRAKTSSRNPFEYLQLQRTLGLSPLVQTLLIAALFALTTLGYFFEVKAFGKMAGYSANVTLLFVPIYEEILFRGILLKAFEKLWGWVAALVLSSILFGLWHLKNIFWLTPNELGIQIAYTAFIFGPIACLITVKTKSVWPAVILHYLHNFPLRGWTAFVHGGP